MYATDSTSSAKKYQYLLVVKLMHIPSCTRAEQILDMSSITDE